MKGYLDSIKNELEESSNVKKLLTHEAKTIEKIAIIVTKAIKSGNSIFLCGNGGSAADAQHIAAEFVGQFDHSVKRPAISASAFTTNTSTITAISNDISFDKIFYRQVEAFVKRNDVVIGISTSGKSKNVIEALKLAKKKKAITISFTGKNKSPLSKISDYTLHVPSTNTQRIQESHITVGHIICGIVENSFRKPSHKTNP